jgi:type II secretory pathway pseudopilin PulG
MTLIEVLVVVAIIVILVAMLLPGIAASKRRDSRIGCVNNLRQIELALKTWAVDNGDKYPMDVPGTNGGTMEWVTNGLAYLGFQMMSNELSPPKVLVCPRDNNMAAKSFSPREFSNTNVSYFVGADA